MSFRSFFLFLFLLLFCVTSLALPAAAYTGPQAAPPIIRQTDTKIAVGPEQLAQNPNEAGWITGLSVQTQTWNCVINQPEVLGTYYVGYWGAWPTLPRVGEVYYTIAVWAISGRPCGAGGAYVSLEYFLPQGVQLAISAQNPVRCFHDYYLENKPTREVTAAEGCPQQPGNGINGGLTFNPPWQEASWPTATGTGWHLIIPVVATQPLNGIDGNPCNVCLQAAFWSIDGNASPTARARVPMSIPRNTPRIEYPAPSASSITHSSAQLTGHVYNFYEPGQLWVDFGPSTQYTQHSGPHALDGSGYMSTLAQDWSDLLPNTTYHWRLRFVSQAGQTYTGADQTFTTLAPQTPVEYNLTLQATAGGSVASNPAGTRFEQGTELQLSATAEAGFQFAGWEINGAAGGTQNPFSLTMDRDYTVLARFAPADQVIVQFVPVAGGFVAIDPPGGSYAPGTQVTLTATPDATHAFDHWIINGVAAGSQIHVHLCCHPTKPLNRASAALLPNTQPFCLL